LPVPRRLNNADERATSYRQRTQTCVPPQDAEPCFRTPTPTSSVYNLCVTRWWWWVLFNLWFEEDRVWGWADGKKSNAGDLVQL